MVNNPHLTPKQNNENFIPDNPDDIVEGMQIEHNIFGEGRVISIEGTVPNRKARVFFREIGEEKQLLLKFARLRIVGGQR